MVEVVATKTIWDSMVEVVADVVVVIVVIIVGVTRVVE